MSKTAWGLLLGPRASYGFLFPDCTPLLVGHVALKIGDNLRVFTFNIRRARPSLLKESYYALA